MALHVVCGLGQVGFRVVSLLLRLGHEVAVVTLDARAEFEEIVAQAGARVIRGDARNERVLATAGITQAESVIAATNHDLVNIEVALDARRLNPTVRIVVRMFDQDLAARLQDALGLHRTFAMSRLSAPAFAQAALGEQIRGAFDHGGRAWVVRGERGGEVVSPVDPSSRARTAHGMLDWWEALREAWRGASNPLKTAAALILGLCALSVVVFQAGMGLGLVDSVYYVITTVTTTGYGDITPKGNAAMEIYACFVMLLGSAAVATLYSFMTDFIVRTRFDQVLGRQRANAAPHVVVVGVGSLGLRVARVLVELGIATIVVDDDADAPLRAMLDPRVVFVHGDARDEAALRRAGVETATAVIAVTDDDAVNLSAVLAGKRVNPAARTVARLFDAAFARKVSGSLPIDTCLSASRIAAPAFAAAGVDAAAVFAWVDEDELVAVHPEKEGFSLHRRPLRSAIGTI